MLSTVRWWLPRVLQSCRDFLASAVLHLFKETLGFPSDSAVKNLPEMQGMWETQVWSLGQEDPLEKEMATYSSILAWKIPRRKEPGGLQSMGSQSVGNNWAIEHTQFSSVQLLSHVQLFATPESTQIHVHWLGDAIQPSHPLSSPSPPALNLSQHQGLFQWVSSLHQVAKVLEFQLQHESFQWTPRTDLRPPLGWTVWTSLQCTGLSRVISNTTVQKHQFFGTHFSL